MNDLRGELPLRAEELEAVHRVIDSGWYVLGSEVQRFEEAWARQCQSEYAIGVGNGMDAIEIGLRALGVGSGDEVITTGMTAFATILAIIRAGAIPVLADIDPETAMLDPESVSRCINPQTRAILLVHLYGQIGPVDRLLDLCESHGLVLVEDCAQSHLARKEGASAGTFGSVGAWSFYPTKNLGALGDAGALTTSRSEVAVRARRLRNYGQTSRYRHDVVGLNSRLDELQASLLSVRLKYLEAWTARRRQIAALYRSYLNGSQVRLLRNPDDDESHVYHLFVIASPVREALRQHLRKIGIQTLVHYPIPGHLQEPCRSIPRDPEGLTATEQHASECLSLPCHPGLTDDDVRRVASEVLSFVNEAR